VSKGEVLQQRFLGLSGNKCAAAGRGHGHLVKQVSAPPFTGRDALVDTLGNSEENGLQSV
jgi:hypothetical protein